MGFHFSILRHFLNCEKGGDLVGNNINPMTRLYHDIIKILDRLVIKYQVKADAYETAQIKANGDRYIFAVLKQDNYFMYNDYTEEEFKKCGVTDLDTMNLYLRVPLSTPTHLQTKLLELRREREVKGYVEQNNYYRMLNGLPDLEDKDFLYPTKEQQEECGIPDGVAIHQIEDICGIYYINLFEGKGYLKEFQKAYSDREYLKFIGSGRIPITVSRRAKNFAILQIKQDDIMESTYREFIRCYEKARIYFVSTAYIYQYRDVITYYDNFIALCIFLMTVQQVSARSIKNAIEREFYDEYMVQLLYETYGVPYFARIDHATQKQIVQNINLLIQNKATDKVMLDIASILGFNDILIYQYYLVKQQKFDDNGRPIILKTQKLNPNNGKLEEVYDYENMQGIHFQRVPINTKNVKADLIDTNNRVEYSELTYYDPFWWEDQALYSEIWKTEYNFMETKYMGITIPYRMTEAFFQSVILLRMIMDKSNELSDVMVSLTKITDKDMPLADAVVLFFALMAKKHKIPGQITTIPSQLIHILEVTDQEINKENDHIEVLAFDFDAFKPDRIEETIGIVKRYLERREYRVVNGHDVDLREDGTQDISAPTHKVSFEVNTESLEELLGYISNLNVDGATPADKVNALNKAFQNIQDLYFFLSYQMSQTTDLEEYYALRKFYEAAFYSRETIDMFTVDTDDGPKTAKTFEEYFLYKDPAIYQFIQSMEGEEIYTYIDHIIYKIEELVHDVGYLYTLNDGFSPLVELLRILLVFFKSYTLDFVELTSLMIVDWDLDNMFRFFDQVQHVRKVNASSDHFGKDFMDLVHRCIAHSRYKDRLTLTDYYRVHGKITIHDPIFVNLNESIKLHKLNEYRDNVSFFDVASGLRKVLGYEESIPFKDDCYKVKIKEVNT